MATVTPVDRSAVTTTTSTSPLAEVAAAAEANIRQITNVEPVATEVKKPDEDPNATRYALLARKEKALRAQQRTNQEREAALVAREKALEQRSSPQPDWKERLLQDPLGVLQEAGLSYDQLTERIINTSPADQKLSVLEKEIRGIKETQTKAQTLFEEQQQKAYEQAVNQIRNDVKIIVSSDPAFETIKAMAAEESVVELIEAHFKENGTVLSNEEAAQQVEDYLVEEALKVASLSKIKSKLNPVVETPSLETKPEVKAPTKTLTSASAQSMSKPMTTKDRRARAIAAFQGKL